MLFFWTPPFLWKDFFPTSPARGQVQIPLLAGWWGTEAILGPSKLPQENKNCLSDERMMVGLLTLIGASSVIEKMS